MVMPAALPKLLKPQTASAEPPRADTILSEVPMLIFVDPVAGGNALEAGSWFVTIAGSIVR